jgi:hypothetical protein
MLLFLLFAFFLLPSVFALLTPRGFDQSHFIDEATKTKTEDWIDNVNRALVDTRALAERAIQLPDNHEYWTDFFGGNQHAARIRGRDRDLGLAALH